MKLSAVINTWNEEKNIKRCIDSLSLFANEIVVVDMESTDQTVKKAKALGACVFTHPYTGYVEPARNSAIEKAKGEWVLIVDADEELTAKLKDKIKDLLLDPAGRTFFRLPRKNIAFGKWIKHGLWWPDYQIRLFRKGFVEWREEIHSVPYTRGEGFDLPAEEDFAIIHYNYQTIDQFIERLNRYTTQQAKEKKEAGVSFAWQNALRVPFDEFIRRFFLAQGYNDGFHGLCLSLLQAFSELIVILKLWETKDFPEVTSSKIKEEFSSIVSRQEKELYHWLLKQKFTAGLAARIRALLS